MSSINRGDSGNFMDKLQEFKMSTLNNGYNKIPTPPSGKLI